MESEAIIRFSAVESRERTNEDSVVWHEIPQVQLIQRMRLVTENSTMKAVFKFFKHKSIGTVIHMKIPPSLENVFPDNKQEEYEHLLSKEYIPLIQNAYRWLVANGFCVFLYNHVKRRFRIPRVDCIKIKFAVITTGARFKVYTQAGERIADKDVFIFNPNPQYPMHIPPITLFKMTVNISFGTIIDSFFQSFDNIERITQCSIHAVEQDAFPMIGIINTDYTRRRIEFEKTRVIHRSITQNMTINDRDDNDINGADMARYDDPYDIEPAVINHGGAQEERNRSMEAYERKRDEAEMWKSISKELIGSSSYNHGVAKQASVEYKSRIKPPSYFLSDRSKPLQGDEDFKPLPEAKVWTDFFKAYTERIQDEIFLNAGVPKSFFGQFVGAKVNVQGESEVSRSATNSLMVFLGDIVTELWKHAHLPEVYYGLVDEFIRIASQRPIEIIRSKLDRDGNSSYIRQMILNERKDDKNKNNNKQTSSGSSPTRRAFEKQQKDSDKSKVGELNRPTKESIINNDRARPELKTKKPLQEKGNDKKGNKTDTKSTTIGTKIKQKNIDLVIEKVIKDRGVNKTLDIPKKKSISPEQWRKIVAQFGRISLVLSGSTGFNFNVVSGLKDKGIITGKYSSELYSDMYGLKRDGVNFDPVSLEEQELELKKQSEANKVKMASQKNKEGGGTGGSKTSSSSSSSVVKKRKRKDTSIDTVSFDLQVSQKKSKVNSGDS